MECVTCGGKEFYKDLGYFYCLECQTQSQDVREHVFQEEFRDISKSSKKIEDSAKEREESKVTSWECYNIILHSLTNQMIELGANKNLKTVVKLIWIAYLEKLQVFDLRVDAKPRLSAVNLKRDVEILYGGKKKRRRRKKSTSDESSSNVDTASYFSLKKERTKRKSALAQAEYAESSFRSTQESSILGTETLTSLKSSSITEENTLKFNHYAKKELRHKLSKSHFKDHQKDVQLILKCHKMTYTERTRKYKRGVHFLSPEKLYCVLYLGLLIIKEQIQLGDLLRFIREGHLNFNNYSHLLQDEMKDKILGVHSNPKNMLLTNKGIRTTTYKLATLLGILDYIEVPDLVKLCERYCREMNLPDQVLGAVKTIISVTNPTFPVQDRDESIPNYEGRCMSFILFVIKLHFGMDGVTEYELSKFAKLMNQKSYENNFFNIQEWLTHIRFRKFVIEQNHFPIIHKNDHSKISSDLYLQHIKSHDIHFDEIAKLTKEMKGYKQLLQRLKDLQHDFITHLKLPSSLTPFYDYIRKLSETFEDKYHKTIKCDFNNDELRFLKSPEIFFGQFDEKIRLDNCDTNSNIIVEQTKNRAMTQPTSFVFVELIENLYEEDKYIFKQHEDQLLQKMEKRTKGKLKHAASLNGDEAYKIHCLPQKRYWLNNTVGRYDLSAHYLNPFLKTYPYTFMQIFEECSRIIEQKPADLFQSFQSTELCLVYVVDFSGDNSRELLVDKKIVHHINQALDCW